MPKEGFKSQRLKEAIASNNKEELKQLSEEGHRRKSERRLEKERLEAEFDTRIYELRNQLNEVEAQIRFCNLGEKVNEDGDIEALTDIDTIFLSSLIKKSEELLNQIKALEIEKSQIT